MKRSAALAAWEPELHLLARDLQGALVPLLERLHETLGPLRSTDTRLEDEPHGYATLSTRGPYERLLTSEWALQLEHPDEFIRRASMGEHLFLELDRRAPSSARESWLLFDTGPSQLGAPRIGQLAVLLAFHRRAREAGITLHWAPLWNFEQPPLEGLDANTVQRWLQARTARAPTAGVIGQWLSQWPEVEGRPRELWFIGDGRLQQLVEDRGAGHLSLEELGARLRATVTPPRAVRRRVVELPLMRADLQVRLLRNPLEERPVSPARPSVRALRLALHPKTELAFSHDSHRLLVRGESGAVIALPLRNSARASYGWPTAAALPLGCQLAGVFWGSRRYRGTIVTSEGKPPRWLGWDGSNVRDEPNLRGPASVTAVPTLPSPQSGPLPDLSGALTWCARPHGITRVFAQATGPQRWSVDETGTFFAPAWCTHVWLGGFLKAFALGLSADLAPERAEFLTLPWKGRREGIAGEPLPRPLFTGYDVRAVSGDSPAMSRPESYVFALNRKNPRAVFRLSLPGPQSWTAVATARAPIEALAVNPDGRCLAWRDADGEIAVWLEEQGTVVLRLHVSDVAKERA